jgi:glycosyltransferase involved in cell wall biosynthesis
MNPEISVIICTHNPRRDYLNRVLEALRGQSFPMDRCELLLIDNKSDEGLEGRFDLSWHPAARVIREEVLGLTHARMCGIKESKGKLLIFVDDDNLLQIDYLEVAANMAQEWPQLGVWSGAVVPEFEKQPDDELIPYLWRLCIRDVKNDVWGNEGTFDSTPWGAGMCIRKIVAERYAKETENSALRSILGRRGDSLVSTEDIDIALTSLETGLGTGVFSRLRILHLIPAGRVEKKYLLKLMEDSEAGTVVFNHARRRQSSFKKVTGIDRLVELYKFFRANKLQREIGKAFRRGRRKGEEIVRSISTGNRG